LELAGIATPRLEAERLVCAALGVGRAELVTGSSVRVTPAEAVAVAKSVSRRLTGEPLQHIEGSVDFRRLTLVSDRRALIPRPETEQLIDLFADWVRTAGPVGRVLEIGIGSGAIALSLVKEDLVASVLAVDVSDDALALARENAEKLGLADRVEIRRCSPEIWSDLGGDETFEAIIANPPYVPSRDIERLATEVRDYDPRAALDGGADGLDVVRTLFRGAPDALIAGGRVFLEIGADQGESILDLFDSAGVWRDALIHTDLAGRPRFATASLDLTGDRPE
jgi:release factor glutamine methyltransferase